MGHPWWVSGKESACQCKRHVWSLIQEDPVCHRATKPMCHNSWVCAVEPTCHDYRIPCHGPGVQDSTLHNKRSHCHEKPTHCSFRVAPTCCNYREKPTQQCRPSTAKKKTTILIKKKKNRDVERIFGEDVGFQYYRRIPKLKGLGRNFGQWGAGDK